MSSPIAFIRRKGKQLLLLIGIGIPLVFILAAVLLTVRFRFFGETDGLYLLRGEKGYLFEVSDDLLLGEYERLLFRIEFDRLFASRDTVKAPPARPTMLYKWKERTGDGYIHSFFPDRTEFLIAFSRFVDGDGHEPSGLFVGGGLPYSNYRDKEVALNETGVAFFTGTEWHHLWCNANESISSARTPAASIYPSQWQYLGGKVLYDHEDELILESSHRVVVDQVPLRIDRFAFYKAGNRYFVLFIRVRNEGQSPLGYYYVYGDEPWVGDYGTSLGNVGWTKDRLYYYEAEVDRDKYQYAGMYDHGNKMFAHERDVHFTGVANFIDWANGARPDLVYFSNTIGSFAYEADKVLLSSLNNRVLMLQWGPRVLAPAHSDLIALAIGMADNDPKTGFPVRPDVKLNPEFVSYVLAHGD